MTQRSWIERWREEHFRHAQTDALVKKVNAELPSSVTPSTRIEIHPADWITLGNEVLDLRARDAAALELAEAFQAFLDWANAPDENARGGTNLDHQFCDCAVNYERAELALEKLKAVVEGEK